MATSPIEETWHGLLWHVLRLAVVATLAATGSQAPAQGLDRFQPKESHEERAAVNRAIDQCVRLIREKTVSARVSIKGPCRNGSGKWVGVDPLENGFKLRFSVTPADSSDGTLLSAIQGHSVRASCTADLQGAVTQFEDAEETVKESFGSSSLCWPAGD